MSEERASIEVKTLGTRATLRLGWELGSLCGAGDVIGFTGDLGAGKTVMIKGLASALGVPESAVVSPTFTLINEYRGRLGIYHFDLYRMGDVSELDSIDYRKYLEGGVCAVEWFERFPGAWPDSSVTVTIAYISPMKRVVRIAGGKALVEKLASRLGDGARRLR